MSVHRYTGPDCDFELDIPEGWRLIRRDQLFRLQAAQTLLSDLDRCEHGRHARDVCGGCNGPSLGNPFLTPGYRVGTTLGARPIIVPSYGPHHFSNLGDASLWVPE